MTPPSSITWAVGVPSRSSCIGSPAPLHQWFLFKGQAALLMKTSPIEHSFKISSGGDRQVGICQGDRHKWRWKACGLRRTKLFVVSFEGRANGFRSDGVLTRFFILKGGSNWGGEDSINEREEDSYAVLEEKRSFGFILEGSMDLTDAVVLTLGSYSKLALCSLEFQCPSGWLRVKRMDVWAKGFFYQRKCILWMLVLLINQI